MHDKANDIVAIAKGLVGVRYRHQGRNQFGLDCAGLVIMIAHLLDLTDKDTTAYSRRPNATEFTAFMIEAGCIQLPVAQLAHGDIVRLNTSGWPVHLGVYEIDHRGRGWYTHAFLPYKKVTRAPFTDVVRRNLSSVWRFPE